MPDDADAPNDPPSPAGRPVAPPPSFEAPPPPPPDAPPPPSFTVPQHQWRSLRGLRTALTWLLGASAIAAVVTAVAYANRLGVISDIEDGRGGFDLLQRIEDADDFAATAVVITLALVIATAACFIVWMFRATKNNEALGRQDPRLGAGWSIGGWFIPLANFVIPVLIMQDIWRGADSSVPRGDPRWKIGHRSALIGWWWGVWLLSALQGFADTDDPSTTLSDIRTSDTLSMIGSLFRIAAAILAILVVRRVTERQEACLRAQQEAWNTGSAPA